MRFAKTEMKELRNGNTDLYYGGFGPDEYYEITPAQTNLITPLFILVPFWENHSDKDGMHWLGHTATEYHP